MPFSRGATLEISQTRSVWWTLKEVPVLKGRRSFRRPFRTEYLRVKFLNWKTALYFSRINGGLLCR
jgi:hypothetical protein